MRRLAAALATLGLAVAAAPAGAEQQLVAQPPDRYAVSEVTVQRGEGLTFVNQDIDRHDVTADDTGPGGGALFASPVIGTTERASVARVAGLGPGRYGFHCSLHPFMTGTLVVAGSPAPEPPAAAGGGPPAPSVAIVTRTIAAARSAIVVTVTGRGTARVAGVLTAGDRRAALRGARIEVDGTRRVRLRPTPAVRRALRHARRARVTVTVRVGDARAATARSLHR